MANVICLGLSSLSENVRGGNLCVEGWFWELGLVLALAERVAAERGITSVPIVFQDPNFDIMDRRIQETLGGNVVQHPAAAKHTSRKTLLFAKCLTT